MSQCVNRLETDYKQKRVQNQAWKYIIVWMSACDFLSWTPTCLIFVPSYFGSQIDKTICAYTLCSFTQMPLHISGLLEVYYQLYLSFASLFIFLHVFSSCAFWSLVCSHSRVAWQCSWWGITNSLPIILVPLFWHWNIPFHNASTTSMLSLILFH